MGMGTNTNLKNMTRFTQAWVFEYLKGAQLSLILYKALKNNFHRICFRKTFYLTVYKELKTGEIVTPL